jgi:hypothetical protein
MLRLLNDMSNGAMLFLVDFVFVLLSDYLNCLFFLALSFHLSGESFPTFSVSDAGSTTVLRNAGLVAA